GAYARSWPYSSALSHEPPLAGTPDGSTGNGQTPARVGMLPAALDGDATAHGVTNACRLVARSRQSHAVDRLRRSSRRSANDVEHERPRFRLVADLVRGEQRSVGRFGRVGVARVDLGQRLACGDLLPALPKTDDADCMVDRLPGDFAAGAELHRDHGDLPRRKLA